MKLLLLDLLELSNVLKNTSANTAPCQTPKLYANQFLCISVLRLASGPRVKLVNCKSALNPPVVYSTDHSKEVVPVLVLLFVALWFILRGDLFDVLPFVILFLCFSVLLAL